MADKSGLIALLERAATRQCSCKGTGCTKCKGTGRISDAETIAAARRALEEGISAEAQSAAIVLQIGRISRALEDGEISPEKAMRLVLAGHELLRRIRTG